MVIGSCLSWDKEWGRADKLLAQKGAVELLIEVSEDGEADVERVFGLCLKLADGVDGDLGGLVVGEAKDAGGYAAKRDVGQPALVRRTVASLIGSG